jgi:hypothetical protein
VKEYRFSEEDFVDLRTHAGGAARAELLDAELRRELSADHVLLPYSWVVIAEALPQEEIVVEIDDDTVAIVHLTWLGSTERRPYPWTTIAHSPAEFEDSYEY